MNEAITGRLFALEYWCRERPGRGYTLTADGDAVAAKVSERHPDGTERGVRARTATATAEPDDLVVDDAAGLVLLAAAFVEFYARHGGESPS